ncbi:unnamed protein product, partial [Rotaria socialis]
MAGALHLPTELITELTAPPTNGLMTPPVTAVTAVPITAATNGSRMLV